MSYSSNGLYLVLSAVRNGQTDIFIHNISPDIGNILLHQKLFALPLLGELQPGLKNKTLVFKPGSCGRDRARTYDLRDVNAML